MHLWVKMQSRHRRWLICIQSPPVAWTLYWTVGALQREFHLHETDIPAVLGIRAGGFGIKHEANFCTHKEVPNKQSHLPSKNTWTSFKTVVANLCCLVTSLKGNVTNFTHGTSFYRSRRGRLPVWIRAQKICGYWGSRLISAKLRQGMRPISARFGRTSLDRNTNPGGA